MFLQCLIAIFLILMIVDRWKPRKFVKVHQQLGNDWRYIPIVGNALDFVGNNEDLMTRVMEIAKQAYERKHKAMSFWLLNKFIVIIADGDQASAVLKSALDKEYMYHLTKSLISNGSLFAPANIWHPRRKILEPTFALRHVKKSVTVFEAQSKVLAELLEDRVGKGNFSCSHYVSTYALDSVCESLFGVNVNMQRQPDHPFFNAFTECFKGVIDRMCRPWLHVDAIYKLLPMYARQTRLMHILFDFVDDLIYKKKAQLNDQNVSNTSKSNFKTFLELLLEYSKSNDKVYTHEELRVELIVLALAGTDTSAVAICFTLLMLAIHSDVQDKVYTEIENVLGDSDKPLLAEDLLKLTYTRAVIKEVLRLYPSVPIIARTCTSDVELPSGLVLPNGCDVVINIWGIHRNPAVWGDDANEFNPDRFISEQIPPNAFVAFSIGIRNCIGQQYGMLSLTTLLVTILRRYRLVPATGFKYDRNNPFRLNYQFMMKEINDFPIQIEYRDQYKNAST